jgi:hypothetical protein
MAKFACYLYPKIERKPLFTYALLWYTLEDASISERFTTIKILGASPSHQEQ